MQIFARGRELFGGGVLKVPDLVLHAVVELVWVLFSLQVKLAADGGVLECFKMRIMVCTPNQIIFDLNPRGKLLEKVIAVLVYRDRLKGMQILLSRTQAGPGRTGKQEQEQTSRNHVQAF